jgi:hypothetical protein
MWWDTLGLALFKINVSIHTTYRLWPSNASKTCSSWTSDSGSACT